MIRKQNPSRSGAQVPVLEVEGLTKRYGQVTTVSQVALRVYPGEIVGLLGANGAGKTTSFHMICGLSKASAGKIVFCGKDVTRWPMHRRCREGLGYLPQDRSTFGALTVEQNLYGAMEFLGYSKRERRELCDELLERFELKEYRKRVVGYGGSGGLSGGERRRLEVARALISRPKVLMLDEPFAACDPETISKIQRSVKEIASEGLAVVINDHAIANTLKITERAYVINKGRVLFSGSAMETLCNPEAIHYYFGHEARDNAETIGKAHGIPAEQARQMVAQAYLEVERRWPEDVVGERQSDDFDDDERPAAGYSPRPSFNLNPRGSAPRTQAPRPNDYARRPEPDDHAERPRRAPERPLRRQTLSLRRRDEAQSGDERDAAPRERAESERRDYPGETPRRQTLGLRRRDEAPRHAPSPRDSETEENRFADKLPGLFGRKRR